MARNRSGPHVDDRAHQQAARRPALDRHALRIAVALRSQMLHAGNEIGERVALHQHLAGVVPRLAQVAAAADVRIRHHHAAIEQAQPVGAESQRQRIPIGPVAVDIQSGFVARSVRACPCDTRSRPEPRTPSGRRGMNRARSRRACGRSRRESQAASAASTRRSPRRTRTPSSASPAIGTHSGTSSSRRCG